MINVNTLSAAKNMHKCALLEMKIYVKLAIKMLLTEYKEICLVVILYEIKYGLIH